MIIKDIIQKANLKLSDKRQDVKYFCVGLNKTGTTSIEKAFKDLGFAVGNQRAGEVLLEAWSKRNFSPIYQLAYTADAFQDIPFSLPYTYQALDIHFPNAKFILSIRNSPEEWYSSIVRYHSNLWADGIRPPTTADLLNASYIWKGFPYQAIQLIFDIPTNEPYNKEWLTSQYQRHNDNICDYFRHRPEKLIVVNVSQKDDYFRLCQFLHREPASDCFPWLNKSI